MAEKKYCYYPPKSPQFYFPKNQFHQYKGFYQPYTFKSKFFWTIYKNSQLIRNLFLISERKIPLPLSIIKKQLEISNNNYSCFINLGTKGPEQKITAVVRTKKESWFVKFAQSALAQKLVENEFKSLKKLEQIRTVNSPSIVDFKRNTSQSYILLLTELFNAKKLISVDITDSLMQVLYELGNINLTRSGEIVEVYSHGDFCPWNILVDHDKYLLIDWEMAENRPLGYDLFTFIFQTSFLLFSHKSIDSIITFHKHHIDAYFNHFGIKSWKPYLHRFAALKLKRETEKNNLILAEKYRQILVNGKN